MNTPLSWLEIDLAAVAANTRTLRRRAGAAEVAAVVKADGYGLGGPAMARAALAGGAGRLCVFGLEEAAALRGAGIDAPVLLLGPLPPQDAGRARHLGVAVTVTRAEVVDALAGTAVAGDPPLPVHVKMDVGMRRLGPDAERALALVTAIRGRSALVLEGFYSHLPNADEPDASDSADRLRAFLDVAREVGAPLQHIANTAATLRFPEMALEMVRPGVGLYGVAPGVTAPAGAQGLRPVFAWRARLVEIHHLSAGDAVSYGGTWTAPAEARVGVMAVGYADGFRRSLSNRGVVLMRGRRLPVVGAVCMNLTLVDLRAAPEAAVGDVATLIGRDGRESISLDAFATACKTIPYEILTGLKPGSRRLYEGP